MRLTNKSYADHTMRPLAIALLLITLAADLAAQGRPTLFPPTDSITGEPPLDHQRVMWYSTHLAAMGEATLPKGQRESYRFLWLRTFHHPIAVRISRTGSHCDLVAKQLDGAGGYAPGRLATRVARMLSAEQCDSFSKLIKALDFWRPLPTDSTDANTVQLDGAQWILEGQRAAGYHLWDIWSPRQSGPHARFRELCVEMIRLSGLTVRSTEVY